jgi:MinD superfamily P-loop ATPase
MKQIVVISGKGGTGKTTIVAGLAQLARRAHRVVLADCDVDAANLALLYPGHDDPSEPFMAGRRARVDPRLCVACSECSWICRFDAIRMVDVAHVDSLACEGCGACGLICPTEAITFTDNQAGWWMERHDSDCPLVHARLEVAQDNSGKLVAQVRSRAKELAEEQDADLLLLDGPPGIGCPVHASLTGCDLVVVVTEPTTSGHHDLIRTLELADHFKMRAAVLINKHDLCEEMTTRITEETARRGIPVLGRIPFDRRIPEALARTQIPLDLDSFARPLGRAWARAWDLVQDSDSEQGYGREHEHNVAVEP